MEQKFGKILIETTNSQVEQCEKWRKVVNTKDLSKSSQSQSRLRLSTMENLPDDILNPKEMRELIMRKRGKPEPKEQNRLFLKKSGALPVN